MPNHTNSPLTKIFRSQKVLWIFAALALQHVCLLWFFYWPGSLPDGVTSGVWMGLAMDFAHGEFYRPLISESGYGGTRYMPLFWVLHGVGIRLLGNPLLTGLALFFFSVFLFHSGLYALMRQIKISRPHALAFACLPMATLSYQMTTLTLRGDFLAAGLGLWGLVCLLRSGLGKNKYRLLTAIFFFGLAFATKLTALYFPLATCLYLFFNGSKTISVALAGAMVWCVAAVLLFCEITSGGNFWTSFAATATGGMTASSAFSFLITFATEVARDPFFLVIFLLSTWAAIQYTVRAPTSLASLYFFVTLASTLFIYTSPGTATNHLIDLEAACVVLLTSHWERMNLRALLNPVLIVMAGYLILAWHPGVPSVSSFFAEHGLPRADTVAWMKQKYPERSHTILSRFSYFEILSGKRPFTLDRFNLDLLTRNNKNIRKDFEDRIRNRHFGLVIESNWPGLFRRDFDSPEGPLFESMKRDFHRHYDQDDPWHPLIRQYYRVDSVRRPFVFLVPREPEAFPPGL